MPRTPEGLATVDGWQIATEATANPTTANLTASAAFAMYMKGDALVFAINDAGTMRYLSIALTGAGTTWTHGTSAP